MVNLCGSEDGEFSPGSSKWIHQVFLAFPISGIVDLRMRKQWPLRENMGVEEKNVIAEALVDRDKIILPPLHIQIGLMKQSVKALKKKGLL